MNRRSLTTIACVAFGAMAIIATDIPGPTLSLGGTAEARVGRPATPMSYAGVARRTTRRAVAVGAGAAATGAYYYSGGPGCAQVVNAYGQIVYQCP